MASEIADLILGEDMSCVLEDYAAELRDVLAGGLAGVYLYGSAVWGAYDPSVSDVDVAVLLCSDPTEGQRRALVRLHEDFGLNHAAAARLDVSFAPLRLVGAHGEDILPYYRDGRFHPVGGGDVNPVMWRTLNERGISVWGPAAVELVPPVGDGKLAENMRRNLVFLSGRMPDYVAAGPRTKSSACSASAGSCTPCARRRSSARRRPPAGRSAR